MVCKLQQRFQVTDLTLKSALKVITDRFTNSDFIQIGGNNIYCNDCLRYLENIKNYYNAIPLEVRVKVNISFKSLYGLCLKFVIYFF